MITIQWKFFILYLIVAVSFGAIGSTIVFNYVTQQQDQTDRYRAADEKFRRGTVKSTGLGKEY